MSRSYTMEESLKLPTLTGSRCMTLAQQLITTAAEQQAALQANGKDLPLLISRPRDRLIGVAASLEVELGPIMTTDGQLTVKVDNVLDRAWGLYRNWSQGQTQLPPDLNSHLEEITQLDSSLFSDGLSFLSLTFREEWAQSELRLQYIAEKGYTPIIEALGGASFLTNVQTAHDQYGKVLGITTSVQEESSPEVRENLLKTINAIKQYVFKVMAWADVEEPGSEDLRDALLVPLTSWVDTAPSTGETAEGSSTGETAEGSSNGETTAGSSDTAQTGD